MEYSVTCGCNNVLKVSATQAGTEIACPCGRAVKIPRLSDLRASTGRDAYEVGVMGAIRRLIRTGELPYGDTCAVSGLPTNDVCRVAILCERTWVRKRGETPIWLQALTWVFLPIKFFAFGGGWTETHGRNTVLEVPLRVREEHHNRLRRMRNQRRWKELLRTVPVYEQLLEEYPDAYIWTGS